MGVYVRWSVARSVINDFVSAGRDKPADVLIREYELVYRGFDYFYHHLHTLPLAHTSMPTNHNNRNSGRSHTMKTTPQLPHSAPHTHAKSNNLWLY